MKKTELHIKNMVCPRCIKVVKEEFEKLNISLLHVELGKVSTSGEPSSEQIKAIRKTLSENGFELIDDKKSKIIESIKTTIIEIIHHSAKVPDTVNSSDYIASTLGYDYSYLSNLFSSVEGITIEKYIINQKIEKVKELLVYDELTLSEISYQLGYSSVQHLSNQFKKVTGLTPSHFKKLKENKRKPLDTV
jgi:AraC-like DNA-binding protein